jgi:hypothetical protein
MTDTQQNLFQKKTDEDPEQESSNSQLSQETVTLSPSIKKEDLTAVKGIGPHLAEILTGAGIKSIKELAQFTPTNLTRLNGVGEATAHKIIEAAKDYGQTKDLSGFTQLEENSTDCISEEEASTITDFNEFTSEFEAKTNDFLIDEEERDLTSQFSGNLDSDATSPNELMISIDFENSPLNYNKIANEEIKKVFRQAEKDFYMYKKIGADDVSAVLVNYSKGIEMFLDDNIVPILKPLIVKYRNTVKQKDTSLEFLNKFKSLLKGRSISPGKWVGILMDLKKNQLPPDVQEYNRYLLENLDNHTRVNIIRLCKYLSSKRNPKSHKEICSLQELESIRNEVIPLLNPVIDIYYEDQIKESLDYEESAINEPTNANIEIIQHGIQPQEYSDKTYISTKSFLEKLSKKAKSSGFSIIKENRLLRSVFVGIDALALKIIHVHEFLDLICIVPIITSNLNGNFTVSADSIEYSPKEGRERTVHIKKISQSYKKALHRAESTIFNDISVRGELSKYIMKYLDIEISPEKTVTHKTLFLRSGPLQYKLLIEPMIICNNPVGFTEKLVPYAYQRQTNIHMIHISQVADYLHYLDQKYFFIETYSEKKNMLTINSEVEDTFMKHIRIASSPFIVYGAFFLLIFLFQGFSLLPLIINMGYGVVGLYMIVIGYIYLKLYTNKKEIKQEFATPYYKRDLGIDDDSLLLVKENLTPKLMEQFGYEILGKNSDSAVIEKIEDENARNYLTQKIMKKSVEGAELFEEDISKPATRKPKIDSNSMEKYSSFLED